MSVETLQSQSSIEAQLLADPGLELIDLAKHGEIINQYSSPLATTWDSEQGVQQNLRAVIQAGDNTFGLIEVKHYDARHGQFQEKYIVSSIDGGQNGAQSLGAVEYDKPFVVGRNYQRGLTDSVSRQHFQIGRIGPALLIKDLDSSNGTSMIRKRAEEQESVPVAPEESKVTKGAIKWLRKTFVRTDQDPRHPEAAPQDILAENPDLWAPSAKGLKELFEDKGPIGNIREALSQDLADELYYARTSAEDLLAKATHLIETGDTTVASDVEDIVVWHQLGSKPIPPLFGKNNAGSHNEKLKRLLTIYESDPAAAREIVDKSVSGFHGTTSASLYSVLQHGLLSSAESRRLGLKIGSGERTYSKRDGQDTISFADWRAVKTMNKFTKGYAGPQTVESMRDAAAAYRNAGATNEQDFGPDHPLAFNSRHIADDMTALADFLEANPDTEEAALIRENFPVAIGVNASQFPEYKFPGRGKENPDRNTPTLQAIALSDDEGEFVIHGSAVPEEASVVIAVPSEKIPYTRELVARMGKQMTVIALEPLLVEE